MRFDPSLPHDSVNVSAHHPLRDAAVLVAGFCGLTVGVVILLAVAIDLLVPYFPPSLEVRLFSLVDLDESDEPTEHPDARTQELQAIVDRLAVRWEGNPYRLQVFILDDADVNAFAFPGGSIAVTRGLLESAESETELAFVLGHEIGHFANRDHLRGLGRGFAVGLTLETLDLGGAGGAIDLLDGAAGIAGRHFDRNQERDADAIGLELVFEEYGHVSGATNFFARLPAASEMFQGNFEAYLATHPIDSDRIDALDAMARERGWAQGRVPPPLYLSD